MKQTKTLKVRVRDKHAAHLRSMAKSVNFVWNYVNELSYRSILERGVFLSSNEIQLYTQGCNRELGLHSHTVLLVGREYSIRRDQFRRSKLSWRKSHGVRRSLGWIPINTNCCRWKDGHVSYFGKLFKVWNHRGLENYRFRSASFNEDARGRWYFNVVVDADVAPSVGQGYVGIDLGLKDTATCSGGEKLEAGRFYRDLESKLATAQRARKRKRAQAIHAKIKNRRKDALHKFSRRLVDQYGEIYVGDVSPTNLAKTNMAKSVYDAGWGQLKTMLSYKCDHAGTVFKEVRETYTTQTCSSCGQRPDSRPRGIAGLGIREWQCSECGVTHDRDINAAKNILALGCGRPAGGISLN